MLKRYFLKIAFDGSNYHGWQIQANHNTIQETITKILCQLFDEKIKIVGCGRTDTGVHAKQYFFHFDTSKERKKLFDSIKIMFPKDIQLLNIYEVDIKSHARYDAIERSYTYNLHQKKDIFKRHFSLEEDLKNLNIDAINKACILFVQETNYQQLCKNNPNAKNYISKIKKAEWKISSDKKQASFHITANRFLHNQIRRMLGVLLNIGKGKVSLEELENALKNNTTLKYNDTTPPNGLFLHSIKYPFIDS